MAHYYILLNGKDIAETFGLEYTAEVWLKTKALAELLGTTADLVDGNTGEVLEWVEAE